MKKLLSILLAVLMVVSVVPMSASAEENITYEVGDIIEFGSYPQSKVVDETLIAELNALAPEWEDWTSYCYYSGDGLGSMVQGDWMRYIDVSYNGNKFRGVKFTLYRPYDTHAKGSTDQVGTEQDDNGYHTDSIYWFNFESIKWRVLDPSTGFVMCETIIDSQPYSNTVYENNGFYNDLSYKNNASDYETSSIRKWLNDVFYNTALTNSDKTEIRVTTLNNDGTYTSQGKTGYEYLDGKETHDKIFLLSFRDAINNNYGFSSGVMNSDDAKKAQSSDYAKSQGVYYSKSGITKGNSNWLLRSASSVSKCTYVDTYGSITGINVEYTAYGVRPAITLDLVKYTCTHEWESTTTATCTQPGELTYTCNLCGSSYTEEVPATGHTYTSEITTPATHLTEGVKTFTCACGDSYTEAIAKLEGHTYTSKVTKEATHLEEGVTTYTCACGDTYTEGIAKLEGHTYTSKVTKEATHLEEGETTYTCECGDSYTEAISKLTGHTYEKAVTAPTCTEKGYTTYTCECGDSYVGDYTEKLDHEYTSEITTPATHLTEGVKTFTCECGDSYTEPVAKLEGHTYTSEVTTEPTHLTEGVKTFTCACGDSYTEPVAKLTGHTYKEVVTEPTCTAKGYTTYTCECGDNYVDNYVGAKEHSYSASVTTPATHTKEGVMTYTCSSCGDTYTAPISKTPEHAYTNSYVVEPTCEKEGYTAHVCDCGDIIKDNYTEKTGHSYNGRVCEDCGKNCSCMCHYSGFMSFIWKIINFFYKLFRVNKVCACGIAHY